MPEANTLFLPVGAFCQRDVVTCDAADPLVSVSGQMRQRNISSVVVCRDGVPVGIFTDRDLRNKVVARGLDPNLLTVCDIMNTPLITIGEDEFLFEALYRMSKHGIHRVGVVDAAGRLVGIVTDSDVLRLQTKSPQQLIRNIEEADSIEELRDLHQKVRNLVVHLVGTGVHTRDLVRMIAHLNDRLLLRLIALLRAGEFADLPERFAFVVLGSEGRREQTLATDQDNAIVYADDLGADEVARIEAFAVALIDRLIAIGVPPCPGGVMASNPPWRRSLSGWVEMLGHWFASPTPDNILTGSMFFDLRLVHGDASLEVDLKAHLASHLQNESAFLRYAAANVLRFAPPLGWFGRIRVERHGDHRGLLDIKKAGIFAITEGVKILALEAGVLDGGTRERMAALVHAGVLDGKQADDMETSFNFLVNLRLRSQVSAIRNGAEPSNFIDLHQLNRMERGRLLLALEGVKTFQKFLSLRFQLDLLR